MGASWARRALLAAERALVEPGAREAAVAEAMGAREHDLCSRRSGCGRRRTVAVCGCTVRDEGVTKTTIGARWPTLWLLARVNLHDLGCDDRFL